MNTNIAQDSEYKFRFDKYSKASWSDFTGKIDDLFTGLSKIDFGIGSVQVGQCGDAEKTEFIMVFTAFGAIMMYRKPVGSFHYFCDESFSIRYDAQKAGFISTSGEIKTVEQMNHVFAIADSYL